MRKDVDTFLDMKTLNTAYNNLLRNEGKFHCIYKKHIKSLILQKVSDVQFSQPKSRKDAEIIYSETKRDQAIDQCMNAYRSATLLKKRLWHRCFPVNFMKFRRTPFYIEHLWWLLLNAPDTYNEIFAAASLIRSDILNKNRWKFTGSYDDYEIPTSLEQLLKWIIIVLKDTVDLNAEKKKMWM